MIQQRILQAIELRYFEESNAMLARITTVTSVNGTVTPAHPETRMLQCY